MTWRSLFRVVPAKAGPLDKSLRLAQAYQAVFLGSPAREDQEIVLADMLANSCVHKITLPSEQPHALWYTEGMRAMYSTIWRHLSLSPADLADLQNAARVESASRED